APLDNAALRDPGTVSPDPDGGGSASLIGRFEGNILGMPALAVPSGFVGDGTLATSIQFEGRFDGEASLLGYGYDYEQATKYRLAPDLTRFIPEPASLAVLVISGGMLLRRRRLAELAS
ncbi:MAG: amidase, partial [Phycisphaerales bacterium]|nr:amidase [Phycisphaerales bacterium]